MRPVPERDLPPGIRSAGSLAAEVMDGLRKPRTPSPTTYTPADLCLLDALDRLRLTRLGSVIEAEVQGRDGSVYRVRLDGSAWACSCPAAVYSGRSAAPCKHARALRIVRSALPSTLGGTAEANHHIRKEPS